MPDTPTVVIPNPLDDLVKASAELLRAKLDEKPLHPHVFEEIAVAAKAIHKACTALDPVLNLPVTTPTQSPLAPGLATEGYGSSMARQLIGALQDFTTKRGSSPDSRKDVMAAIVVAEKAGFTEDAERLRAELYGDEEEVEDDSLSPQEKVDRANGLIEESKANHKRAKALLESVKPNEFVDDDALPA